MWTWDPRRSIDEAFFATRIREALARRGRSTIGADARDAERLVNAEADALPGLIVDRYADVLVYQFTAAGVERWRDSIISTLREQTGCSAGFERSDADVRSLEGLIPRSGELFGTTPTIVEIEESSLSAAPIRLEIDVRGGHKTGGYLDQAANRARIGALASGADVLNCFCYTGAFSLHALAHGARRVVSIDSSADALERAVAQCRANALDATRAEWVNADVFAHLRTLRDRAQGFDLIILDPPKFAPTAGHLERAARAYKDINLLALKLLRPGGLLATFSCSGGVSAEMFRSIVAGAAADAGVGAEIVDHLRAGQDHPVLLEFPEGEYLKGLLLRKRSTDDDSSVRAAGIHAKPRRPHGKRQR